MKTSKQTLTSPYYGLLLLEAMELMNKGWRIEQTIKPVWVWKRWGYMYKTIMIKDGNSPATSEVQSSFENHLKELSTYNETVQPA